MSIAVADNFQYKGGKPLDARMKFATILDMTAAPVADLYDGCFSYVVAEKKYYSYDSNNENDPHLGKWREYSAGAEYSDFTGATSQDAGSHGLVPAPTTADVDKYLKGDGSWGAISMPNFDYSNEFGTENIYDTQEKMIGQWTDGKPLYQKVIIGALSNSTGWTDIAHNISNIDFSQVSKISIDGFGSGSSAGSSIMVHIGSENVEIYNSVSSLYGKNAYVTFQYTKTTDSAMSIGTPNDYSTTEKIVGTWIDGKPLWQKTVDCGALPNNTTKNVPHGISNLEYVVDVFGVSLAENDGFFKPLPLVYQSDAANYNVGISVSLTNIELVDTTNRSQYSKTYVTLRYTKTS